MAEETRNMRKIRQGVVVSDVNDKTIVVQIKERKPHPIYKKMMTSTKKFHAHDENNEAHIGDTVRIMETRPLSKMKRWRLLEIVEAVGITRLVHHLLPVLIDKCLGVKHQPVHVKNRRPKHHGTPRASTPPCRQASA